MSTFNNPNKTVVIAKVIRDELNCGLKEARDTALKVIDKLEKRAVHIFKRTSISQTLITLGIDPPAGLSLNDVSDRILRGREADDKLLEVGVKEINPWID